MLYIFDLDDTLIEGYLEPKQPYERIEPLPGRVEKLAELQQDVYTDIAICTNQAGVAFGYVTEEQAHSKIYDALFHLGLPTDTPYAICFSHPKSKDPRYNTPEDCARRKPSGAMIRELASYGEMLEGRMLYVGDRPEDQAAAQDVGVPFMWAWQFFGDPEPNKSEGS